MLACVCRLIFRGDPCIILGSDILSVSMSAPRYPSEMKKPDTVPCNNALNLGQWGFSITPQMEPVPLHTIKKRQHYVSTVFKPENKWTCFCTFSRIWNHISAVCQRLFEVFFFFFKETLWSSPSWLNVKALSLLRDIRKFQHERLKLDSVSLGSRWLFTNSSSQTSALVPFDCTVDGVCYINHVQVVSKKF